MASERRVRGGMVRGSERFASTVALLVSCIRAHYSLPAVRVITQIALIDKRAPIILISPLFGAHSCEMYAAPEAHAGIEAPRAVHIRTYVYAAAATREVFSRHVAHFLPSENTAAEETIKGNRLVIQVKSIMYSRVIISGRYHTAALQTAGAVYQ